ncbi:MAG TPA: CdaR family protein [Blastocatellia bacterium]|nr:CdaR family protein [Blastocatellia bacterium]
MQKFLDAIKDYARDYVLENTGLKVLALLITGVLWLSVASRPVSRVTLRDVPIEFQNLNSPSLIVSKADAVVAQVLVEGPRDAIDALRSGEMALVADMTDVEAGVRVIRLKLDANRLPANVTVRDVDPRTIGVTVERVIEKEVPVVPNLEGHLPPGYEIIRWEITPETVRVKGAESQLRDVTELSTETVSLTGKTEPFTGPVAIYKGALSLTIIDEGRTEVMLSVNIGEVRKERVLGRVPVAVVGAPSRGEPIPRFVRVTLFGATSAVDAMTAADVNVQVEYDQSSTKSGLFTPKVTVAPGYSEVVTVRSVEPASVRIK